MADLRRIDWLSDEFVYKFIDRMGRQQHVAPIYTTLENNGPKSFKVRSLKELTSLGFISVGAGFRHDAKHHLWQLSRDGEGYVIERTADEETIRKAKETKTASKKTATVFKVEQTFTIPGFEHITFSP